MSLYFGFMSGAGLPRSWNNAASTAPIEMSTNDSVFFLQILFPKGLEAPLNTLKCVERPRKNRGILSLQGSGNPAYY